LLRKIVERLDAVGWFAKLSGLEDWKIPYVPRIHTDPVLEGENRARLYPRESGLVEISVEDMGAIEHWPIAFEARDWCGGTRRWFEVKVRAEPRLASGEGPMFEVEVLNPRFDGDRGWRARMQVKGVP
jgi:hypothetical protein